MAMRYVSTAAFLFVLAVSGAERKAAPPSNPEAILINRSAKVVKYNERETIPLNTRIRYTTVIVLPEGEKILDFVCGDKDFWSINGAENIAYVKPAKERAATNLNLVTSSGKMYSFLLTENAFAPDLKVFVEPSEESTITSGRSQAKPKFISASEMEATQRELASAQAALQKVRSDSATWAENVRQKHQKDLDEFARTYPEKISAGYAFARDDEFRIEGIFHDERFTYISGVPRETPMIFAYAAGKGQLVKFDYRDGLFRIDKVVRRGYMQIGKKKLPFSCAR